MTAPFYAMPICAAITNTMGGIVVDGNGAVLQGYQRVLDDPHGSRKIRDNHGQLTSSCGKAGYDAAIASAARSAIVALVSPPT